MRTRILLRVKSRAALSTRSTIRGWRSQYNGASNGRTTAHISYARIRRKSSKSALSFRENNHTPNEWYKSRIGVSIDTNDRMLAEHTSTHLRIISRNAPLSKLHKDVSDRLLKPPMASGPPARVDDDMHAAHMRSILHRLALASGIASDSAMV